MIGVPATRIHPVPRILGIYIIYYSSIYINISSNKKTTVPTVTQLNGNHILIEMDRFFIWNTILNQSKR